MSALMARLCGTLATAIVASLLFAAASAQAAPDHSLLFSISEVPSEHPPLPEFLEDPCGLTVDAGGNVYVSDYYHDRFEIFGPSGGFAGRYNGTEPLDGPCGLALDSAGDLYVNIYHRSVVRFAAGEFSPSLGTVIAGAGVDASHPTGVAVDEATGNLFVDDRTYVAEYAAPVHSGEAPVKIGLGTLQDGYGIAVSGFPATAGDIYVPDAATDTVKIYNPAEPVAPIGVIDGAGTPQGGFASLTDSSVAVDNSNGHLYVFDDLQRYSEHPEAALDEFNAAGDYRGQLPRLPLIVDGGPSGVAVDNSTGPTRGRVYLTSGNSEKASIFAYGPTTPAHTLTVAKAGAGTGTVKSEPAGIDCGTACTAEYNAGEAVTLVAAPDPGSAFAGWSVKGAPGTCTEIAACHLTLGADAEVSAEFEVAPAAPLATQAPAAKAAANSPLAPATGAAPAGPPASHLNPNARRHHHPHRHKRHGPQAKRRSG
jgi:hypothetical protein